MTLSYWLPALVGGVIAATSPLVLRPILQMYSILDTPNDRSSHDHPTLRAAGLAQLLGVAGAVVVTLATFEAGAWLDTALAILVSGIAAGVVGLGDDLRPGRGHAVLARAGLQLLIGGVTAGVLAGLLGAPPWAAILAASFIAAYINIANFMDGVNGISGMHGLVVGVALSAIGLVSDVPWLQVVGLVVAATYVVFLPWNFLGGGMFLGDVGSYLLGGLIGASVVGGVLSGVPIVAVVSPVSIYLADTLVTLVRRASRGEPVLRAHRTHAYQRLLGTGLSHLQVAVLVTAFSMTSALVGWLVLVVRLDHTLATILVVVLCTAYLILPRVRGDQLPPRPVTNLKEIDQPRLVLPRVGFRPARWVILGASGFVGSALVANLESRGCDVVRMPAPRLRLLPTDDPVAVVSLARTSNEVEPLSAALDGADVVINAAGLATPDAPADDGLYGANAMLPALVAVAAADAGVPRVIHLSSAAVQGRRPTLDDTLDASPFSPYSHSKALGERAFLANGVEGMDLLVIRATSVQGPGRRTTESFRRIAQSPLASVAAPGTQPTVVSSIDGLVDFVLRVASTSAALSPVLLQPWEGYSVDDVLRAAGGRPRVLPRWLCLSVLACARVVGRIVPEIAGAGRRLELMWLGQGQGPTPERGFSPVPRGCLEAVLSPSRGDA